MGNRSRSVRRGSDLAHSSSLRTMAVVQVTIGEASEVGLGDGVEEL